MILTEEDRQAGFHLTAVDLLVYLHRGEEVIAVFPIGVGPESIRQILQMERIVDPPKYISNT